MKTPFRCLEASSENIIYYYYYFIFYQPSIDVHFVFWLSAQQMSLLFGVEIKVQEVLVMIKIFQIMRVSLVDLPLLIPACELEIHFEHWKAQSTVLCTKGLEKMFVILIKSLLLQDKYKTNFIIINWKSRRWESTTRNLGKNLSYRPMKIQSTVYFVFTMYLQ